MEALRVQILYSPESGNGGQIYVSGGGEPRALELATGEAAGTRYEPILDLGTAGNPATHLFVVGIELEEGHADDFNDWYNTEHLPALARVPGVNRAVRYQRVDENHEYPAYLALYDITSPDIAGNPDWVAAVETPWTNRLRPHFKAIWRGGYQLHNG